MNLLTRYKLARHSMHPHLALIKNSPSLSSRIEGQGSSITAMDIILSQARLMEAGSLTFKAIKAGEIADILAGLVALAYYSAQALAQQNEDIVKNIEKIPQTYQMLTIMRLLSDKINACSSGAAIDYSTLYFVSKHLATDFLNADFDKAFRAYDEWYKNCADVSSGGHPLAKPENANCPDLTDCLFE